MPPLALEMTSTFANTQLLGIGGEAAPREYPSDTYHTIVTKLVSRFDRIGILESNRTLHRLIEKLDSESNRNQSDI